MGINLYGNKASRANVHKAEIDLRLGLQDILQGSDRGYAHGSTCVLRKARRNEDDKIIPCQCVEEYRGEPDRKCRFCLGVGYYTDDVAIIAYKSTVGPKSLAENFGQPGQMGAGNVIFYFEHEDIVRKRDFIVEPYFDLDGKILNPIKIRSLWDIENVNIFRADHIGRVEYYCCLCKMRPEGLED